MTLLHNYAETMLQCYLDDDEYQPEAIQHYLQIMMSEKMKMDVERKDDVE